MKRLAKVYERITGAEEGADRVSYGELPRPQQSVLIRLFGGGTVRNADEAAVHALDQLGLISNEKLTALGEEVCREALPGVVERLGRLAIGTRSDDPSRHRNDKSDAG
jgi:hypothetical protein